MADGDGDACDIYDRMFRKVYDDVERRYPYPREGDDTILKALAAEQLAVEPILRLMSRDRQPGVEWVGEGRRDDDVGIVVEEEPPFRVTVFVRGQYGAHVAWQIELEPNQESSPLATLTVQPGYGKS